MFLYSAIYSVIARRQIINTMNIMSMLIYYCIAGKNLPTTANGDLKGIVSNKFLKMCLKLVTSNKIIKGRK